MDTEFYVMPMVISLAFFAMIGFIVWNGTNARNRRAQMQAEVQAKLIDRFGTAREFIDFLQSPAGREFVTGVEVSTHLHARDRVIGGYSKGLILSLLGLGFLAIWLADDQRGFTYPGFILLGLGIGFFLSAFMSMKLSKSYGLINGGRGNDAAAPSGDMSVTRP